MQEYIWTTCVVKASRTTNLYSVADAIYFPFGEHTGKGPENLYVSLKSIHAVTRYDHNLSALTQRTATSLLCFSDVG